MNEKKKKREKATTKTTRKFTGKTFKVDKCMTSETEILPPRERHRSKRNLQSSRSTFFSVCSTLLSGEKKKKKENSGNVELLTQPQQQQKKSSCLLGVHSACIGTMPGPAIEIDDLRSIATCQAPKKDNPLWFLPVFQATSVSHKKTEHTWYHTEGSLAQTSTVKDNHRQDEDWRSCCRHSRSTHLRDPGPAAGLRVSPTFGSRSRSPF